MKADSEPFPWKLLTVYYASPSRGRGSFFLSITFTWPPPHKALWYSTDLPHWQSINRQLSTFLFILRWRLLVPPSVPPVWYPLKLLRPFPPRKSILTGLSPAPCSLLGRLFCNPRGSSRVDCKHECPCNQSGFFDFCKDIEPHSWLRSQRKVVVRGRCPCMGCY